MRFPQKLTLLILGCVLVLGELCLIQYRLVYNTYKLEQAAYFQQLQGQLSGKTQSLTDSLNSHGMKMLLSTLQYQLKNDARPDLSGFQQELDQTTGNYRYLISQTLLKDSLLHNIGYSFEYTRIVLYHDGEVDTLLGTSSKPLLLSGKGKNTFLLSEGKQQVGFKLANSDTKTVQFYSLAVWNRPGINAADWQKTVFRRMQATLLGSVVLIAALVLIFFLIFSALFRQKRIADVTTDFANNMTHELKTPLSAAALVVKSLRTPEAKLNEQWFNELLEQLDRQHGKIRSLMDNVLTSALDKPIGMAKLQQFNLKKILEDLSLLATAAGRDLVFTGQVELVICTDPDLLASILFNLLDNALKYTPAKSPLNLHIRHASLRQVIISLKDEGPGIERKYQRNMFHKFFRVPRSGGAQIKGLGLGLYLSQIQAGQLNGKLTYETTHEGGSIFNLILPHEKDTDPSC